MSSKRIIRTFALAAGLLLAVISLLVSGQAAASPKHAAAGRQSLRGQEALRFLQTNGLLETVADSLATQGGTFLETARLTASGTAYDDFGYSVAVDGETALVGARYANVGSQTDQGAAYVFTRTDTGWTLQGNLTASDGAAFDAFGWSVALAGNTAAIGSPYATVDGNIRQGAAYLFTRTGTDWSQQAKLVAGDGAPDYRFGTSVALDGETALVGAFYANVGSSPNQGAAYVFTRSGTTWTEQEKLTASDGTWYDYFGYSIALDGDTALVGAYPATVGSSPSQGAAYVFTRTGSDWTEQAKLTASDGAAFDQFGWSVALDGDTALVGVPFANVGNNALQGAAYVFIRTGSDWTEQDKLTAADGAAYDYFGFSVALDGETGLVGASNATVGANYAQGAAYVFTRNGVDWSQEQKLTAGDGAGFDAFGISASLDGAIALVGANLVDVSGRTDQGAAYVYEQEPPVVTITLTPLNEPIVIPPGGGSYQYQAQVTNNSDSVQSFDGWVVVDGPGGLTRTVGPLALTLQPGESKGSAFTQAVPGAAPAGNYTQTGYVGTYPDVIIDSSDSFTWQKAAGMAQEPMVAGWNSDMARWRQASGQE